MESFSDALISAILLIIRGDSELWFIVLLSLRVSLSAVILAALVGIPIGAALAIWRFSGRQILIVIFNALMGLPPVVVWLCVYLLLSKS